MKGSHTPGPWEAHRCTDIVSGENNGRWAIVHNGPIAYVGDTGNGPDEAEATARLIAAAPALLAALERVARYFEQHGTAETQGIACDTFAALKGATNG